MADYKFSQVPAEKHIKRSQFNRSYRHATDFNAGYLIPFHVDEVLPADTHNIETTVLARLATQIHPTMDNLFIDFFYFFVPYRIVWDHWNEFMGENRQGSWYPVTQYSIPQLTAPAGGWLENTVADYMGIPTRKSGFSVSALFGRCYAMIWQEFFRDQNLQNGTVIYKDDATRQGVNTGVLETDGCLLGIPLPVAKDHDYFTSCLPAPQKGPMVSVSGMASGDLPVITKSQDISTEYARIATPLLMKTWTNAPAWAPGTNPGNLQHNGASASGALSSGNVAVSATTGYLVPTNLYATAGVIKGNEVVDTRLVTNINISELRQSFQVQKMYERDARGGSRYVEILLSHFGVVSPDSRQQRPEYLGGKRVPINIQQVEQTSSSVSGSPLARLGAYSLTVDSSGSFTKSFTEHGVIIGVCCVRASQTYQQGLNRMFSRLNRTDFYLPVFANISEQPVYNKEIYLQGSGNTSDNEVFGYQEAWADYRYYPNRVSGNMRSSSPTPLDSWHYAQNFSNLPVLSDAFIRETRENIDRTIEYDSGQTTQIIADFYITNRCTRPMPMYSVPGLVDHN